MTTTNVAFNKMLEANIPSTLDDGNIIFSEKGNMYVCGQASNKIKITDILFVDTLPTTNIEQDKIYVLKTDNYSLNMYNGTKWYKPTGSSGDSTSEVTQSRTNTLGYTFSTLKDHLNNIENNVLNRTINVSFSDWEIGSITSGINITSTTRIRTSGYHSFDNGTTITIEPQTGYKIIWQSYDSNYKYQTMSSGWITSKTTLVISSNYYRFIVADTSDGTASISYANHILITIPFINNEIKQARGSYTSLADRLNYVEDYTNDKLNYILNNIGLKDFELGSYSLSNGIVSPISSATRCKINKPLSYKSISVNAVSGYSIMLIKGTTQIDWTTSYNTTNNDSELYIILRKNDNSVITDINSFLSNFTFTIDDFAVTIIDDGSNYLTRPSDGVVHFSVEVNGNYALLNTDSNCGDTYTTMTDHGILVLPTNYNPKGEPIRLCVVCHGAGATPYPSKTLDATGKILGDPQRILTKMGYAVFDMYANPYDFSGSTSELHYGNPLVLQCYIKGYEYIIKNYNVKTDGIFVSGSSMGGLSSFQIVQSGSIPVIAQAGFNPCIDIFKQAYCNPWATNQRSTIANYFKFEGTPPTFTGNYPPTADEITYFKSNIDKLIGYYPIIKNVTNGDILSILDYLPSSAYLSDTTEQSVYNSLLSIHHVPIKIWHNKDDSTVAFRYSVYWIDMVRRSGQLAFLRAFTTGGHSGWASGVDVSLTDIDGNAFTAKTSQYECYLWFKRFDH